MHLNIFKCYIMKKTSMSLVKIFVLIISLTCPLKFFSVYGDTTNTNMKKPLNFLVEERSVSSILDGHAYYIKPYLNNNKALDIPYSNYADGINPIIYDSNGWNNQRFVLEKSFENYYRIRPIDAFDTYIGIDYTDEESQKLVLVSDSNYNYNRLIQDKFLFYYIESPGCFIISTMISGCTKFLHPINNSLSNSNLIEQGTPDSLSYAYFFWNLDETDNICANTKKQISIAPGLSKSFWFDSRFNCNYVFYLSHLTYGQVRLSLHEDNSSHTLIYYADTSFSSLHNCYWCEQNAFMDRQEIIEVRVTNFGSDTCYLEVGVYPYMQVMISTMYDYNKNYIDSVTCITESFEHIESFYCYPNMQINMKSLNLLNEGVNGRQNINSYMLFNLQHGNPGGISYYEGTYNAYDWIDIVNMPVLNSCLLTFWGSCESDVLSIDHNESGISSSLARRAVEKGASYSIGFRDKVCSLCLRDFAKSFIYYYSEYQDMLYSGRLAHLDVDQHFCISCVFFPGVRQGSLYSNFMGNITRYNLATGLVMNDLSIPSDRYEPYDYFEFKDNKYIRYEGMITNLLQNEDNYIYLNNVLNNYSAKLLISPNVLIKHSKGCEFLFFDVTKQKLFDCLTYKELDLKQMSLFFERNLDGAHNS